MVTLDLLFSLFTRIVTVNNEVLLAVLMSLQAVIYRQ